MFYILFQILHIKNSALIPRYFNTNENANFVNTHILIDFRHPYYKYTNIDWILTFPYQNYSNTDCLMTSLPQVYNYWLISDIPTTSIQILIDLWHPYHKYSIQILIDFRHHYHKYSIRILIDFRHCYHKYKNIDWFQTSLPQVSNYWLLSAKQLLIDFWYPCHKFTKNLPDGKRMCKSSLAIKTTNKFGHVQLIVQTCDFLHRSSVLSD